MEESSSWLLIAVILAVVFLGCAVVIKRFFIDKKYFGGSQFVGRQIYKGFQNTNNQENIEHVIYMEEEERQQDSIAGDEDDTEQQNTL
ncbi:MAG: hypothetical protein JSU65_12615 [Candidatus Zixiibacteriota bacterium]|nr:MAG: hypothetical protein JSU65_12615 [candidate division Zixibacteria bacterium]